MNRRVWRRRTTKVGSAWGPEAPSCTMTMTADATTAGATECITMQSWQ
jgi:hypothetical protein